MLNHNFAGTTAHHLDKVLTQFITNANVLSLGVENSQFKLCVPSLPGHPCLTFPTASLGDLVTLLRACGVSRVHVQHWIGVGADLEALVDRLGAPLDLTVHDYLSI